jgi:ElaB/YqjD/DUF883 family membrane-anchored ribosome-binding protein
MKSYFSRIDIDDLNHDIRRLMKATADVTDETVVAARKRLSGVLGRAGDGADRAGKFMKDHPCETAAMALLAGIIAGFLLSRKSD